MHTNDSNSISKPLRTAGTGNTLNVRAIAYYLPQYHPIPENDAWWEPGFTEWTNVTRSRPLFPGHYQPNLPSELGFYDLRVPEARERQAQLARVYGIEGFCYWHYWFGAGRRLLERPFAEVLQSGRPDFPFCLAWANETWSGFHYGAKDRILIEQTYPGVADYEDHFNAVLPALADHRYIKVDGKPLFVVYKPQLLPNSKQFIEVWRELASKAGLTGIHFVGLGDALWNPLADGFDACILHEPWEHLKRIPAPLVNEFVFALTKRQVADIMRKLFKMPKCFDYAEFVKYSFGENVNDNSYPCVIPNWDTTPRNAEWAVVLHRSSPELFEQHLMKAIKLISDRSSDRRIVFIKSWNEWAEGNYLEPDERFGRGYLEAVKRCVTGS